MMNPEDIPRLRTLSVPPQSGSDALVTSLAALLDRSVMRAVTYVVEKRVLPRDMDLDTLRESVRAMLDAKLIDNPGEYFLFVRELESSGSSLPNAVKSCYRRRLGAGKVYRRKLESTYLPCPDLGEPDPVELEGDSIQFEHWVHEDNSAIGSVIVLHGFAMGWPIIDAVALSARQWFERGFSVVAHLARPRTTPGCRCAIFRPAFYRPPSRASGICSQASHP